MSNGAARIVDHNGTILDIVNNYARISFNFGPTLLSWLEREKPATYRLILEADQISLIERGGHGNALAQGYHHLILPLASPRDQITEVRWGIFDFESRFNRKPEGIWLPETAVDLATLQVLAEAGIRFTILSPHQARRIRKMHATAPPKEIGSAPSGEEEVEMPLWEEVSGSQIDPTRPYRCPLANGLFIDLFFYDSPISRAVAFEKLLKSGEGFVNRLAGGFSEERDWPQLLHIATDGESYGHHFTHGDMALAFATSEIERKKIATLTNYGEYLSLHPPTHEVEIHEMSSWSCSHGVARWKNHCGCAEGHSGWNQRWRLPLREGLDRLKETLDQLFEEIGGKLLFDPWETRNQYIQLIRKWEAGQLTPEEIHAFLHRHQKEELTQKQEGAVIQLLEMQKFALMMFTSCAWFFDEISGLETTQVLKYAAHAIELAKKLDPTGTAEKAEETFIETLGVAQSNLHTQGNGAKVYRQFAKKAIVTAHGIAAHYAILSLIGPSPISAALYGYQIESIRCKKMKEATATLKVGTLRLTHSTTFESSEADYLALHLGGPYFYCVVRDQDEGQWAEKIKEETLEKLLHASHEMAVQTLRHHFGGALFTRHDFFGDVQNSLLVQVADQAMRKQEGVLRQSYRDIQSLLQALQERGSPMPRFFLATIEQVLCDEIKKRVAILPDLFTLDQIVKIIEEAKRWGIHLDPRLIKDYLECHLAGQMTRLMKSADGKTLDMIHRLLDIAEQARLPLNLWEAQNLFHLFIHGRKPPGEIPSADLAGVASLARVAPLAPPAGVVPLAEVAALAEQLFYHLPAQFIQGPPVLTAFVKS